MQSKVFRECDSCGRWTWREAPGAACGYAPRCGTGGGANAGTEPLRLRAERVASTPVGATLLGLNVTLDLYARNAFGLLGIPASADQAETDSAAQAFANLLRLDPAGAVASRARSGCDEVVPAEEIPECVSRLEDPRWRFLCEVFWPHLRLDELAPIGCTRFLPDDGPAGALAREAGARQGLDAARAAHATAIAYHNLAISGELRYLAGKGRWNGAPWGEALGWWARVWGEDAFWAYLEERASALDDPRMKVEDVAEARLQLPGVLLAFHSLLARTYAKQGAEDACRHHLQLIRGSEFDESARSGALAATVQGVAGARLQGLVDRVSVLADAGKKLGRAEAEKTCAPVLAEALELLAFLRDRLELTEEVIRASRFDALCDPLLTILGKRVDYSGDHGIRTVYWSLLLARRMLRLPVSDEMRRRLEGAVQSDLKVLYPETPLPKEFDPTRCWFVATEEADSDASLEMAVHKIVGSKGATVQWKHRKILVPRSALARDFHSGRVKAADIARRSPTSEEQAFVDEIRSLEEQVGVLAAREGEQVERAVARERAAADAALEAHDGKWGDEKASDKATLQRVRAEHRDRLDRAKRAHAAKLEPLRRKHAGRLQEAQAAHDESLAAMRGPGAWLALEIPALFGGFIGFELVYFLMGLVGVFSSGSLWVMGAIAILGTGAGVAAARRIRRRQRTALRSALDEAIAVWQREAAPVDQELEAATARSADRMRSEGAEADRRLKRIVAERAEIESSASIRIARLREDADARVAKAKQDLGGRIEALKERLGARRHCKPEAAQREFPAYVSALAAGFRDGIEPSQREIEKITEREVREFMDSLDYRERMALGFLKQYMTESQFADILGKLLAMPKEARRQLLYPMAAGQGFR